MKFWCGAKFIVAFCLSIKAFPAIQSYAKANPLEEIEGFFEQHCITCHNSSDQSGDRDFEELSLSTDVETQLPVQEIIDQITLGQCPR